MTNIKAINNPLQIDTARTNNFSLFDTKTPKLLIQTPYRGTREKYDSYYEDNVSDGDSFSPQNFYVKHQKTPTYNGQNDSLEKEHLYSRMARMYTVKRPSIPVAQANNSLHLITEDNVNHQFNRPGLATSKDNRAAKNSAKVELYPIKYYAKSIKKSVSPISRGLLDQQITENLSGAAVNFITQFYHKCQLKQTARAISQQRKRPATRKIVSPRHPTATMKTNNNIANITENQMTKVIDETSRQTTITQRFHFLTEEDTNSRVRQVPEDFVLSLAPEGQEEKQIELLEKKKNLMTKLVLGKGKRSPSPALNSPKTQARNLGQTLTLTQATIHNATSPAMQSPFQNFPSLVPAPMTSQSVNRKKDGVIKLLMPDSPNKIKMNFISLFQHRNNFAPIPICQEKFWKTTKFTRSLKRRTISQTSSQKPN